MKLQIKDIAHYLLGQEFELYNKKSDTEMVYEGNGTLISIRHELTLKIYPLLFTCGFFKPRAYKYDEVIPIMRHISDLTDDECIELCKLSFWIVEPHMESIEIYENGFGKKVVSWGRSANEKYLIQREFCVGETYNQFQTIYLLSIGVDCLELIDRGIAKRKEVIK